MAYNYRELQENLISYLNDKQPKGVILTGIVGCGKTTLVQKMLSELQSQFQIFSFTGDDILFRNEVANDSQYLLKQVQSKTNKRSLIFVDEVQKTESVFDALKIAFDSKQCSFIVSGSNPAYLSSVAKKRLQRRAYQFQMLPFSISEILFTKELITQDQQKVFSKIVSDFELPDFKKIGELTLTEKIQTTSDLFFQYGGLPLAHLSESTESKLMEIRLTVERGFELFHSSSDAISENVKLELAQIQSQEFTYKNILQKTRIRNRDLVNSVLDELINHGYLVKKKPLLLKEGKTSYLSIYSYIDPGIRTYLAGRTPNETDKGFQLEGYIHARLDYFLKNYPLKSELGYYKEHTIDINGKTKFSSTGEVDFILNRGKKILPIEVKYTTEIQQIKTSHIEKFILENKALFGIIIYGGVPYFDKKKQLLFWPYWLV